MSRGKAAVSPKPVLTGWCNPSAATWSHQRCKGANAGHPCPCKCHTKGREPSKVRTGDSSSNLRLGQVDADLPGWDDLDQLLEETG